MSTFTSATRHRLRYLLAIVGVSIFVVGLLMAAAPNAAGASLRAVVAVLGADYWLVAIVGILAFLLLVAILLPSLRTGIDQATPPAAERVHPVPRVGEPFDDFADAGGLRVALGDDRHDEVRARLREAAIAAVMRAEGCTHDEAATRIDEGRWTAVEEAAAFFAESSTPALSMRLRAAIEGTSPYRRGARATADEISRLDEEAAR